MTAHEPCPTCRAVAIDLTLIERSVSIRAAYAFGDWPPIPPEIMTPGDPDLAGLGLSDPLWARYLDGDR